MTFVGAPLRAEPISFGVTPLKPASRLAEEWGPLIEEIGRRAGVELAFRTAHNVPAFGERLALGEYDIAYMNPYQYSVYSAKPGYRAFAREQGRPLVGVIIVRKDSPYRQLKDLTGQTVIFPTPLAFAASMLTQAEMRHQGVDIKARYVQSHDSVLQGVAVGGFAAGGTIAKMLESDEPGLAGSLRVLAKTDEYLPHPFAAHPRVPRQTLRKLRAAFLSLNNDDTGRRLLEKIAFKAMENANDKDYNDVRRLDMDKLIETVD
jgi:phosphonate transport system substrate-binding protein